MNLDASNTFIISLAHTGSSRAVERWKRMKKRLEEMDIRATRWDATTPDKITETFFELHYSPTYKACAESHMKIWKKMVAEEMPYAFIMEDDACFDYSWRERLSIITSKLSKDCGWHMIMLNAMDPVDPLHTWSVVHDQYLAGSYILSLEGARVLVRTWGEKLSTSDWMTRQLQIHNASYSYFPWLVIQEGCISDLQTDAKLDIDRKHAEKCLADINYSLQNYQ